MVILFSVFFASCEKIDTLLPPDNSGDVEKTGTGYSDAKGILFVMNEQSTVFVNPASNETYLETDDVTKYLANGDFARPLNTADPLNLSLDVFPTLVSKDFMAVQDPQGGTEQADFVGAFGNSISEDWHINSNWWLLEPQDVDYGYDPETVITVEGSITTNTTWTSDNHYLLKGQVFVRDGVTLTIEPGTIIFGQKATGIQAGVLCFNRGSKIDANGTPENPIVFTGTAAAGERTRGQWGGIVFLGKAPSNKGDDVLVEGIQGANSEDGLYGGNDDTDNKGSFSYWRVEYAGIAVNPGNELNSITFGGIGFDTEAHHIIISNAGDDAMEWFGGSVNLKYIATYNTLDDDMDMDTGFSGSLQYLYLVRNPYSADESGSSCFEVSSSSTVGITPQTKAVVSNATVVGPDYQLAGTDLIGDPKFRGGVNSTKDAQVTFLNSIFIGCPIGIENP